MREVGTCSGYVVGESKEGAKEAEHDADVPLGKRKALQLGILGAPHF